MIRILRSQIRSIFLYITRCSQIIEIYPARTTRVFKTTGGFKDKPEQSDASESDENQHPDAVCTTSHVVERLYCKMVADHHVPGAMA